MQGLWALKSNAGGIIKGGNRDSSMGESEDVVLRKHDFIR